MTADTAAPLPGAVVRALRCSVCGAGFELRERCLRCASGHSFDLAKQGYVNLLHARTRAGTADTADMVAARVEFLGAGHYDPLTELLSARAAALVSAGLVLDAGAGTGHYLGRVLRGVPADGLALDVSAAALRRAARVHPRIGAAVWNLWDPWPVGTGVADLLLNVFAPRNPAEFHRVLKADGALLVVSPGAQHLGELAGLIELLDVGADKRDRLDSSLAAHFTLAERERCEFALTLPPADVRRVVGMGPNAHHLHRGERLGQLAEVTDPVSVTASFDVSTYRPRPGSR